MSNLSDDVVSTIEHLADNKLLSYIAHNAKT